MLFLQKVAAPMSAPFRMRPYKISIYKNHREPKILYNVNVGYTYEGRTIVASKISAEVSRSQSASKKLIRFALQKPCTPWPGRQWEELE